MVPEPEDEREEDEWKKAQTIRAVTSPSLDRGDKALDKPWHQRTMLQNENI